MVIGGRSSFPSQMVATREREAACCPAWSGRSNRARQPGALVSSKGAAGTFWSPMWVARPSRTLLSVARREKLLKVDLEGGIPLGAMPRRRVDGPATKQLLPNESTGRGSAARFYAAARFHALVFPHDD
jgi:hypothetical protein